jgi:putative ABC transport system permease protein
MLRNYFILASRNLVANKVASFINIVGLSIAVASAIAVFLILRNFWTLDDFHAKGDRIFMVEYTTETDHETATFGDAPAPIAAALTADFPQVKQAVRIQREGVLTYSKESVIEEMITYADTNFFELFTFPLKYGSTAVLRDPTALVLSSEMAEKYFPNQNPIGQPFTLINGNKETRQFTVQGVAEEFPTNVGFTFDFLTGYHAVHTALKNQDWTTHVRGVFIELGHKNDANRLAGQMQRYVDRYNASNREHPITSFVFDNLRDPASDAHKVYRRPAEANDPLATLVFSAMALLMMGLSCFNYVNISLGAVTRRLKEIGVRKVLGSTRRQIIAQFMTENLLLCLIALLLGLLITAVFLVPLFNDVMVMTISLSFAKNGSLWVFLAGILIFTAVASGAYPALYISAFRPIAIFAGKLKFGRKNLLSRGLLVGQFVLAFLAVILGVVITSAGMQWKQLDWGYDPGQTLVLRLTDSTQYTVIKDQLAANPSVLAITGTVDHVGESQAREEIYVGEQKQSIARYNVGADYPQTLGLELAAGKFLAAERTAENAQLVLVNETFVQQQSWEGDAVGQTIRVGQKVFTVAGVVRDFKLFGSGALRPSVLFAADDPAQYQYLMARFAPGTGPKVAAALDKIWQAKFPTTTAAHFFQKDVFDSFNTAFENVANGFGYVAGLALFIACLGLYGLAAQHFSRRVKEVSVRKVLGASVSNIILLVNREFLFSLTTAGLVANGLAFLGIRLALEQMQEFTGTFQPSILSFLSANVVVFLTATVAVGIQSWKVANVQLAEVLRSE